MPFTVNMPKLSPTMEEGVIAKWHKKEGDKVADGELLVEVATDKATVEYNALDGGYLRKILVAEGGRAAINEPIALFTETQSESIEGVQIAAPEKKIEKSAVAIAAPVQTAPLSSSSRVKASPLAKKLAQQRGIDLSQVEGSGPRGRITSRDLESRSAASSPSGAYKEVALTPMRKVIAGRLQKAKQLIPHIYVRQEINVGLLDQMREQLKSADVKITFNDLVIKASALALRDHPSVNSGFHEKNGSIMLFQAIDIAVAVTVPGGLITPIIRNADKKSMTEISSEIKELAARAKQGKLQPEEYQGGSFTISNMGMLGITDFCAIINPPQAAILAVGGIEEAVWVKNREMSVGKRMNLVLSADHRVVDGVDAAQFIKSIQKYLENPTLLLV